MNTEVPVKRTRQRHRGPEMVAMSLRVYPEELEAIRQAAKEDNRPASVFARLAVMRGLHEYKREPRALTDKNL